MTTDPRVVAVRKLFTTDELKVLNGFAVVNEENLGDGIAPNDELMHNRFFNAAQSLTQLFKQASGDQSAS